MRTRTVLVEDLMSTALVTAKVDDTVSEVDLEMKLAGIRHIPVVDFRNRLIGIASQRDLLRALARSAGDSVEMRSVMKKKVWTVSPDASAADAVDLMLTRKIGCTPVVRDDGELVGIVTETDFLALAHDALLAGIPRSARRRAG